VRVNWLAALTVVDARYIDAFNSSRAQLRAGLRCRESFLPGNGDFKGFTAWPVMKLSLWGAVPGPPLGAGGRYEVSTFSVT